MIDDYDNDYFGDFEGNEFETEEQKQERLLRKAQHFQNQYAKTQQEMSEMGQAVRGARAKAIKNDPDLQDLLNDMDLSADRISLDADTNPRLGRAFQKNMREAKRRTVKEVYGREAKAKKAPKQISNGKDMDAWLDAKLGDFI